MEKMIVIDGREVKFRSSGAVTMRYKAQFGRNYFADLSKMGLEFKGVDLENITEENMIEILGKLNLDLFLDIAWVFAKTADPTIPEPFTWLDSFDEFPIVEVMPHLQELLTATMSSKKK